MLPTTNSILLDALLQEGEESTWTEFDGRYRPVLFAFARRLALGDEDAREVAQDVLVTFVEEYRQGRYDRSRGRLRSWLFSIARARVARVKRERAKVAGWRGNSALADRAEADQLAELWEAEWRRAILRESLRQLRAGAYQEENTLRAFEALVLEGRSAGEVAQQLGMTTNAVYVAKFRTMERLRAVLARLEEEW